jgi:hypothetical protein
MTAKKSPEPPLRSSSASGGSRLRACHGSRQIASLDILYPAHDARQIFLVRPEVVLGLGIEPCIFPGPIGRLPAAIVLDAGSRKVDQRRRSLAQLQRVAEVAAALLEAALVSNCSPDDP